MSRGGFRQGAGRKKEYTEGFMGMDVSCMFPDLGVMVGQAVTVTLDTTTHGRKHDRNVRYELFEAI